MTSLQELSWKELAARLSMLQGASSTGHDDGSGARTLYELQLHQLELEMQNRELREAQQRLEESRAHYADLYDHAPVGYLTLDRNGWVLQANLTAAALLGRKRDELVGAPFVTAAALGDAVPFFLHLRKVARSGRMVTDELESRAREGLVLQITSRPIGSDRTGTPEFHVIVMDITEKRRAEIDRAALDKERRARAAADAANHMKDQFLGIVSHELRTPLNAVLGWAEVLSTSRSDAALVDRGLSVIQRCGKSLACLVDDILDVSRIVSGKLRFEMKDVKVDVIVRSAIESLRSAAAQRRITVRESLTACKTVGDPVRLEQVVNNLLSNALKFSAEGGTVEVTLERDDEALRLRVSDEGCGIDAADLPHVFDSFRQAASTTARTQRGLGLGLAIARHIVEAHEGTIEAHSQGRGFGATLAVVLPSKATISSYPPPSGLPGAARKTRQSIAGLSILCVDDDDETLELLGITLGSRGALVQTAGSVSAAHGALLSFRPDVVLTDLSMSERDGYDLLAAVRSLPAPMSSMPVIALTAHARVEDGDRVAKAGFDGHVTKPVDFDDLVKLLCQVVAPE